MVVRGSVMTYLASEEDLMLKVIGVSSGFGASSAIMARLCEEHEVDRPRCSR